MCGIIYFQSGDSLSVAKSVLKRYYKQKTRGHEGFGIVALSLDDKKIGHYLRRADEKDIVSALELLKHDATEQAKTNAILFHHRHPTSTPNFAECAHPILVQNEMLDHDYYVVHNGVIQNDDTLKDRHEKEGFTYNTKINKKVVWESALGTSYEAKELEQYNDSEALAIELACYIDGQSKNMSARGSMAFVVIQTTKDGVAKALYYGRNSQNPLFLDKGKNHFCLKSEGSYGDSVVADELNRYDYATELITREKIELGSSFYRRDTTSTATPSQFLPEQKGIVVHHGEDFRGRDAEEYLTGKRETVPMGFRSVAQQEIDRLIGTGRPPSMTYEEFLKIPSLLTMTIPDLLAEGNTLEDIDQEINTEQEIVIDLMAWEDHLGKDGHVKFLEGRLQALDQRLQDVWDLQVQADDMEEALEEAQTEMHGIKRIEA